MREDIDAVHFVTHGYDGAVKAGRHLVVQRQSGNLCRRHIGLAGCPGLRSGPPLLWLRVGRQYDAAGCCWTPWVHLTGADVAASDDLTGSAWLGGDWDLEYVSGEIEASDRLYG